MNRLLLLITLAAVAASSQNPPPAAQPAPDLSSLETSIARRVLDLRKNNPKLKTLKIRRDLRVRQEACAISLRGPDPHISGEQWYKTSDPTAVGSELSDIAQTEPFYEDHVAVGVWYVKNEHQPGGMFWVLVYFEPSESAEWWTAHFYLTDAFMYATEFDKDWKKNLPTACKDIKQ